MLNNVLYCLTGRVRRRKGVSLPLLPSPLLPLQLSHSYPHPLSLSLSHSTSRYLLSHFISCCSVSGSILLSPPGSPWSSGETDGVFHQALSPAHHTGRGLTNSLWSYIRDRWLVISVMSQLRCLVLLTNQWGCLQGRKLAFWLQVMSW